MVELVKGNIVVFPFMAQGHINPFLSLSLQLYSLYPQLTITFINTPLNILNLKSSIPPSTSDRLHLRSLPFLSSQHPGLPHNVENTDSIPYPLVIRLLQASLSLRPSFYRLLEDLIHEAGGSGSVCVVADIFFGWTASVARELGIFHAVFGGTSGYGLACYYSIWKSLPHRKTDEEEFVLDDFPEASAIHVTQLPLTISEADGTDPWSIFQEANLSAWSDSNAILFNSVQEFDEVGFEYFRRKLGVEVWPVGPVGPVGPVFLPQGYQAAAAVSSDHRSSGEKSCLEWLDSKPEKSVLYISFGTMNTISSSHMMQLALALESSSKDFIWVVRPPMGFDITSEFRGDEWLPKGFEEWAKESGKGLLVRTWAPQVEILSHRALSVFLTHCGWNSALEGLGNGVPMLGWPMAAEQFFNAKLLEEEMGVCIEFVRGKTCEIRHEELREKIETVMGDTEQGREMRRKAGEAMEVLRSAKTVRKDGKKGSSLKGLEEFLSVALKTRTGGGFTNGGKNNGFCKGGNNAVEEEKLVCVSSAIRPRDDRPS